MEAHIERMIAEKIELEIKVVKLTDFVLTEGFDHLSGMDQYLLITQANHMGDYLGILKARLALAVK